MKKMSFAFVLCDRVDRNDVMISKMRTTNAFQNAVRVCLQKLPKLERHPPNTSCLLQQTTCDPSSEANHNEWWDGHGYIVPPNDQRLDSERPGKRHGAWRGSKQLLGHGVWAVSSCSFYSEFRLVQEQWGGFVLARWIPHLTATPQRVQCSCEPGTDTLRARHHHSSCTGE